MHFKTVSCVISFVDPRQRPNAPHDPHGNERWLLPCKILLGRSAMEVFTVNICKCKKLSDMLL